MPVGLAFQRLGNKNRAKPLRAEVKAFVSDQGWRRNRTDDFRLIFFVKLQDVVLILRLVLMRGSAISVAINAMDRQGQRHPDRIHTLDALERAHTC
jgi:hypothetical protein